MANSTTSTVLVTGGSGFVASHLILRLLSAGHTVRTTVRHLSRENEVRKALQGAGATNLDSLSFYEADLMSDDGWVQAVTGCDYVQHVASPFPSGAPSSEDELIIPAREGTLRVLRAALNAHVKRVVLTSSFAAIGYGQTSKAVYSEEDWSDVDKIPAYHKSKTLAEKAAWDFISENKGKIELAVVNPVGIFGPVLSKDFSSSITIIKRLLDGGIPACPRIYFNVVDVRDLAALHIQAMLSHAAAGQRFIGSCTGPPVSLLTIAKIIKAGRPGASQKVPARELPSWLVKGLAIFSPSARALLPNLGEVKQLDTDKAITVLGWKPRPMEDVILDTVDSLINIEGKD